jgi:hypothetical protein
MLVALLVAAMAIYLLMADEIEGSSADRKSYIAFVVGIVVVKLVLSIGARGEWPIPAPSPVASSTSTFGCGLGAGAGARAGTAMRASRSEARASWPKSSRQQAPVQDIEDQSLIYPTGTKR